MVATMRWCLNFRCFLLNGLLALHNAAPHMRSGMTCNNAIVREGDKEFLTYKCYEEFDWEVQWQKEGDSLARYLVRIGEMMESIKIIQQALEGIPGGPYENLEIRCFDREKEPEWNEFETNESIF
ncbi:NAD(P)H-quinone oxidoreductase subunit H, chloroplastic [Glycine max]|nr:NAD(P)H-quinone oxidoreductase subunit H, chloroplastic [Glycine max]